MDLKVGMYIKTRDGNISKIKYINKFIYTDKQRYGKHYIEKASENIIDLIEVGDYVNGMEVIAKDSDNRLYVPEDLGQPYDREFSNGCFEYTLLDKNFEIKSVVTKELFNSVKYEVKE